MKSFSFLSEIRKGTEYNGWAYVMVPDNIIKRFIGRRRVPVCGKLDEAEFRTSLYQDKNLNGYLFVSRPILQKIKKKTGDLVLVSFSEDMQPREVKLPVDMEKAFEQTNVLEKYQIMAYSHKKEIIEWVESAKKPETRQNRIVKAILMLEKKK